MRPPDDLPGVVPAGGPEPTLEWVDQRPGVVGAMDARVGSDPKAAELVLLVVGALRGAVAEDTWSAIVDELPFPLRATLRTSALPAPVAAAGSWYALVEAVATGAQHPPERAAWYVRAVLASLRSALPRGLVDAIAAELPTDLAAAWRDAR